MKVKIKKSSALRHESLYALEDIMGDSDGHGCGFGGEDISWYVAESKNKWLKRLDISQDERNNLSISFSKSYDDIEKDDDVLFLRELPKKWQNRLLQVLKTHTFKRSIPDEK